MKRFIINISQKYNNCFFVFTEQTINKKKQMVEKIIFSKSTGSVYFPQSNNRFVHITGSSKRNEVITEFFLKQCIIKIKHFICTKMYNINWRMSPFLQDENSPPVLQKLKDWEKKITIKTLSELTEATIRQRNSLFSTFNRIKEQYLIPL